MADRRTAREIRADHRRLMASVTVFLVVAAAFGVSYDRRVRKIPVVLRTDDWGRPVAYGQMRDGTVTVSGEVDFDATDDGPRPFVFDRIRHREPRLMGETNLLLPGFRVRHARLENSAPVWSVELSSVLPAVAASVLLIFAIRRMRRPATQGRTQSRVPDS